MYNKTNTTGGASGTGPVILPNLQSAPPGFSGVRISRSLVFVDSCFPICGFSFGYGFDNCFTCFVQVLL
jgi:hypothetical protein